MARTNRAYSIAAYITNLAQTALHVVHCAGTVPRGYNATFFLEHSPKMSKFVHRYSYAMSCRAYHRKFG